MGAGNGVVLREKRNANFLKRASALTAKPSMAGGSVLVVTTALFSLSIAIMSIEAHEAEKTEELYVWRRDPSPPVPISPCSSRLSQKWADLLAWVDETNEIEGKTQSIFIQQVSFLRQYLHGVARVVSRDPKVLVALGTLLASEIWIKEGNLDFPFGVAFEVFDFLEQNSFERAVAALPEDTDYALRQKLVTKARNLQAAVSSTLLQDLFR